MANSTDNIFVTYVDAYHDLLKVWGQPNRTCATYIVKQLHHLVPEFNRASPPPPYAIRNGMFCFAKHADDYYRARIVSDVYENYVTVVLIDYGNRDMVHLSNIRISCGAEESVLMKMVPQAEEFYLANVGSRGGWPADVINEVRRDLCYDEYNYKIVNESCNPKFIQINFRNEDYAGVLVRKEMARLVSLKDQILILRNSIKNPEQMRYQNVPMPGNVNYGYQVQQHEQVNRRDGAYNHSTTHQIAKTHHEQQQQRQQQQQQQQQQQLASQGHVPVPQGQVQNINTFASSDRQYSVVHSTPNAVYNVNNNNVINPDPKNNPVLNSVVIEALANQLKQHLMKDSSPSTADTTSHNYITQVLEVGSTHNVYVSYIDDGPWSFSIQLVSSEHELNQLMDDLATCDLVPIKLPVVLGYPCIAKSKQYDNNCRGVVVNISHSAVKIFFVDFGNTEDLPVTSIFELPVRFFKVKAMSQKFALSGLQRIKPSEEIKRAFVEVVENELLLLHVTTLEGENLPTCDLYLKNVNIKRILNEKVRHVKKWDPIQLPQAGVVENVVVTWIDSPQKFFVQLKRNDKDLENLKQELAEWGVCGEVFNPDDLVCGAVCICCFTGDNEWYRAVITSVNSKTSVTVFYVDYGNTETVSSNMVKKVGNGLIRQMNTQAIECCLQGWENRPVDPSVNSALESLILEKELRMQVVYAEKSRVVVKLFDNDKDVLLSLLHRDGPPQPVPNLSAPNFKEMPPKHPQERASKALPRPKFDGRNKSDSPPSQSGSSEENWSWRKKDDRNPGTGAGGGDNWRSEDNGRQGPVRAKESFKIDKFASPKKGNKKYGFRRGRKDTSSEDEKEHRGSEKNWRVSNGFDGKKGASAAAESKRTEKSGEQGKGRQGDGIGKRMKKAAKENEMRGQRLVDVQLTRYPVKLDRIVPAGVTFKDKQIEIGSVEEVIVTYFLSPSEIYVQLVSKKDEFRRLMEDMQVYYATKLPFIGTVKKGDKVVAQFREDGVLYRAIVVEANPLKVRYADYGNEELTERDRLWPMDKKFMELEAQSVRCSLPDLKPNGCDSWPEPDSQIDKIFEHEKYTCTFLRRAGDGYEVELLISDTGKNVSDELISSGFALRDESSEGADTDAVVIQKRTPMDFTLMPNENFNVYVSHVVDMSEFYVQIRCNVLQCEDEDGNGCSEEQKVKTTPDDIPGYSSKVIRCFLTSNADDELPPETAEEFRACSKKFFIAHVLEVVEDRLKVTLYDLDGQILNFLADVTQGPDHVRPITSAPVINQGMVVTPSYLVSPKEIYIHCMADVPELEDLSSQMLNFYNRGGEDYVDERVNVRLCAAKSIGDDCWYRAHILLLNDASAKVFYIDFGNIEEVPRENIKRLDPSFKEKFGYARKVSLNIDYSEDCVKDIHDKVVDLINDKLCLGYFAKRDDLLFAEFVVDEIRVTDELVRLGGAHKLDGDMFSDVTAATPKKRREKEPQPQPRAAVEDKVFISHVSSPSEFWIHRESISNELEAFQNNVQSACLKGDRKEKVEVGDVVGALFTDQVWYRVKVVSTRGDVLSVQFIDYGNSLEINATENGVVELREDLAKVPVFASCCSLRGRWKENAGARFEEIITEHQDPFTLVELEQGSVRVVDLLQSGVSVTEKLTREGYAADAVKPEERAMVYVTHINSPDDFYVHREGDNDALDALINGLFRGDSFEDAVNVEEGELYCAKFEEDDMWYRAKVIRRNADDISVLFVDYGNTANVPNLKLLPPELKAMPAMALNCSLAYGDESDEWSEAACNKFAEYLQVVSLKMEVVLSGAQKSVVKLSTESGECMTETLAKLCEKDGRRKVFVTHVNSPSDFYVVDMDDTSFKVISERLTSGDALEELPAKEVGKLCASKFEDGSWYRAEIRKICDDFCEVFFIDFGNTSLSSDLRALPEDVGAIQPLAKRCSLNFSVTNIPESVKEEFRNLAGEGATAFRCRVIEPGNPDVVSLMLDGKKLEEVLLYALSERSAIYNIRLDGENQNEVTEKPKTEELRDVTEDYENSNLEDDARAGNMVANETDEEKRVKFAIITSENTEGFKSDDEKGIMEGCLIGSAGVNVPDNELLDESDPGFGSPETGDEAVGTDETESGGHAEGGDLGEDPLNRTMESEDIETEGGTSSGECNTTASEDVETGGETPEADLNGTVDVPEKNVETEEEKPPTTTNASNSYTGEREKIVPGSVSRGESADHEASPGHVAKIPHSDKIVPGCVARGLPVEEASSAAESACEAPEVKSSESSVIDTSSVLESRDLSYQKISHQDRVLPGCVSSGIVIESFPLEKTGYDEKLISSTVNGTTEDGTS